MTDRLFNALEVCLEALDTGASIENCLQLFPELAGDLRPSLEAALAARSLAVVNVPADAMNRTRTRLLGRAAQLRGKKSPHFLWLRVPRIAISALLIVLVLFLTSGGLLVASAKSLPGDSLYSVKQVVETLHVQFTPSREQKHIIEHIYQKQHIEEVQQLIALDRVQKVTYEGIVETVSPEQWIVDGIPVSVSTQTVIIGHVESGRLVEVEGITRPDGWVEAHEIHLREYEFSGQVESMGTDQWIVSGIPLQITSDSQIGPGIHLNDPVLVLVRSEDDDLIYTLAILNIVPIPTADKSVPTATATPLLTDTPNPTSITTIQGNENGSSDASETEEAGSNESGGNVQDPEPDSGTGSDQGDGNGDGKPQVTPTPEPHDEGDDVTPTPESEHEQDASSTPVEDHDKDETPEATDTALPTPDG
jgi:hypothetical protein